MSSSLPAILSAPHCTLELNRLRLSPIRNPTYSGRFELPDNLKPMFRPIAMMIPHHSLIGEVILFSVGFTSAKVLATKIVYLYNLSNSQLSQQDHYDFGMRAIKAVLLMAGEIKRSHIKNPNLTDEQSEEGIMLQALIESNLPKLLKEDNILFLGILRDLFPQVDRSLHEHGQIEQAIRRAILTHHCERLRDGTLPEKKKKVCADLDARLKSVTLSYNMHDIKDYLHRIAMNLKIRV